MWVLGFVEKFKSYLILASSTSLRFLALPLFSEKAGRGQTIKSKAIAGIEGRR
jgi:hypothetical protein